MQNRPTFGVAIFQTQPIREIVHLAQLADELGYSHLWVGDSPTLLREAYVTLGALAMGTSRIKLGAGVVNPVTYHPAVTASAFTSLQELANGRAVLGIGSGDSALESLGLKGARLQTLREAVQVIRALLQGREVDLHGTHARITYASKSDIPILLGCSSPRMLQLAGEVGDGVIFMVGATPRLIGYALEQVRLGAARAGKDPSSLETVAWVPTSISADDARRAKDNVRPHAARWALHKQLFEPEPPLQQAIDEIRRVYDYHTHLTPGSQQAQVVTDQIVDLCAIAGTPDQCRRKVEELRQAGVSQVALVLHGENRAEQLRLFTREVLGKMADDG